MQVKQIATLTNAISQELLGESAIITEDLSNIVEIGKSWAQAADDNKILGAIADKVGKQVFEDKKFIGKAPKILKDSWEYGSIMEYVSMELPQAEENESWELVDGQVYDNQQFYKPTITAKYFNKLVTFEIPMSIIGKTQMWPSMKDGVAWNKFMSMMYNTIANAMKIRTDALIMRTINNLAAEVYHADNNSGVMAINVLALYNADHSGSEIYDLGVALKTPEFLKYASFVIAETIDLMQDPSTLYNVGGKERFTDKEDLHFVALNSFLNGAQIYLYADTYHKDMVQLPAAEKVTKWQASGTRNDIDTRAEIKVRTASGDSVDINGVLAVAFDDHAAAVCNENPRVTTFWNPKGEFQNEWHKLDSSYMNNLEQNAVVFYAYDTES